MGRRKVGALKDLGGAQRERGPGRSRGPVSESKIASFCKMVPEFQCALGTDSQTHLLLGVRKRPEGSSLVV